MAQAPVLTTLERVLRLELISEAPDCRVLRSQHLRIVFFFLSLDVGAKPRNRQALWANFHGRGINERAQGSHGRATESINNFSFERCGAFDKLIDVEIRCRPCFSLL